MIDCLPGCTHKFAHSAPLMCWVGDEEGRKDDAGKPEWHLVPWGAMEEVTKVLTYGARKYAPDNWKLVPDARPRYTSAALRHFVAWIRGERLDPETGLHHLAHAVCCLLFLIEREDDSIGVTQASREGR